jgi:DNA invertase Pin-like site-specific DNA recombinase
LSKEKLMIGAAYIRVSTGKQEELSPDSQKRLILDYAKANDIVIPEEYIFMENGISGRKADKRPQFQKMIALAKAGKFEIILLWKFSRFARNQEESIVYKSMLKKVGVDVVSISEPLVDGPFGSLIERIIEWMDEFYSIRLSGDVTRGMTEKAMRGGYQSRPPLGYRVPYHNAVPEIVPEEADIIRKIFDNYVNGNLSTYQIAKNMNALGFKTSHGKNFEKRSIEYIIDNPCYAGYVRWNRTENSTNIIKPQEEWIIREGNHDAIISNEMFEAAQARRKAEYSPRGQRPSETYKHWLSGVLKCSSCGRTLAIAYRKNRYGVMYASFQCYGYNKGKCLKSHNISSLKIEPIVMEALKETIETGSINFSIKQPDRQQSDDELYLLEKQLERLELKEKRIKAAYIDGIDTLDEYKENKTKLDNERNMILEELEVSSQTDEQNIDSIMLNNVRSVYDILSSNADISEKSEAIKSIVEKIVFNKEEMNIDVYYYYTPFRKPS